MHWRAVDLWLPLRLSQHLGASTDGTPVPVPFPVWLAWHAANAGAILKSATCTDNPFLEGM